MRIWNEDSLGKITRIEVILYEANEFELHVGTESKPTNNKLTATIEGAVYTFEVDGNHGFFELHNLAGAIYIKSIIVYYE